MALCVGVLELQTILSRNDRHKGSFTTTNHHFPPIELKLPPKEKCRVTARYGCVWRCARARQKAPQEAGESLGLLNLRIYREFNQQKLESIAHVMLIFVIITNLVITYFLMFSDRFTVGFLGYITILPIFSGV